MERQYPPFGHIPGPVLAGVYVIRQTSQAALSLTNFEVLPTGLLATLRTSTRDTSLFDVTYSFEAMAPGEPTQLDIWVETDRGESRDESSRIAANLASGSRGQDDGINSRVYVLWFPVDLSAVDGALTIRLNWPEAGLGHEEARIEPADVRAALGLAYAPESG
jgi:hypothetical protein